MIGPDAQTISPIAPDVYAGLTSVPKCLPPKLFYDAAGSSLFEEITRLPEYYLTRTEAAILQARSAEICRLVGKNVNVIELGAGSAEKTKILLTQLLCQQLQVIYAPVDVSSAALQAATSNIHRSLPRVRMQPIISELDDLSFLARLREPRFVLFIGSTIGNLEDSDAVTLLRRVARHLHPSDRFLLGTDLVKDTGTLVAAYNDAPGVTARFNLNLLCRINRELGGTFDLDCFKHVAVWNAERSRIEMHLQSRRDQQVYIRALGLDVGFAAGEQIHTENSYKYTLPRVRDLLARGGFKLQHSWLDERRWYAVHLAHVR